MGIDADVDMNVNVDVYFNVGTDIMTLKLISTLTLTLALFLASLLTSMLTLAGSHDVQDHLNSRHGHGGSKRGLEVVFPRYQYENRVPSCPPPVRCVFTHHLLRHCSTQEFLSKLTDLVRHGRRKN